MNQAERLLRRHAIELVNDSQKRIEIYLSAGLSIAMVAFYGSFARWLTKTESRRPDYPFRVNSDVDLYLRPAVLPQGKDELEEYLSQLSSLDANVEEKSIINLVVDYHPTSPNHQFSHDLMIKQISRNQVVFYNGRKFIRPTF
jgi:predicted nucleotidyltransferase